MSLFRPLLAFAAWLGLTPPAPALPLAEIQSWAVFYGAEAPVETLRTPDLLVLEPDHPWNPTTLRRPGQKILAYLSLGEVHKTRAYFPELQRAKGTLVGPNPNWPDAQMVDPRSPAWRRLVLDRLAPEILAKGYDGFFFDTLDTADHLDRLGKHPGARSAMAQLIKDLRKKYPEILLLPNGGLPLMDEAGGAFSALTTESVFTDYQFQPPTYRLRDPQGAEVRRAEISRRAEALGVRVLVIEYADTPEMRAVAWRNATEAGFVPFVSDIGLTRIEGEP
ncbi:hypothetical protein D3C86_624910 [compost metagenome]